MSGEPSSCPCGKEWPCSDIDERAAHRSHMVDLHSRNGHERALSAVFNGGGGFTGGERRYLKFQFEMVGGFWTTMFNAMNRADPDNLERLALAFPEEVAALRAWREGDLARRFEMAGVVV